MTLLSFHRRPFVFLFALICGLFVAASLRPAFGQANPYPPLIDRELFFGDPEISGAQISPDGKFIAFIKPFKGTRNIWVKRTDKPFDAAKPLTADKARPVTQYFWSRDGKYILFSQDKGGDENYLVYAVNPADSPAAGQDVPATRNLTDVKGVRAVIYAVPRTEPDAIYVGLNDRDPAWHDLYKIKISTGEKVLVRKNSERITSWVFDLKDQLRMATRAADNGDTEVLRVDDSGFSKVYSCNVFESCGPIRYHKDGKRVYFLTNKGDIDLTRLELFDPATGKEEPVESDPMNRVDFGDASFSDVTDDLVATTYDDERERIYWKDKGFEADYKLLQKKLPGREIGFVSGTKDERLWLIVASSDTEPGERYLFDRQTKKLTLQYRIREKLNRDYLAPMTAVRYKSSDGLEIPAYLTLPKMTGPAKNLPAIILPHGGPWGRDSWGYNGFAQFLANRGYAVLAPNFRASTGYGKKFLDAGNKQWGDRMQDDLTWGVKYLIAQGIADPKRIGIMGGSYGGYATLAGVTFTPDLYAAAVDIVGPSNLITLLETIPPYWEPIRKLFYARMGDPATPEGRTQMERQSPLNHATKIKTPLLVVQGANDPRVNKREADQIVIALRDRGFPVEYLVAPDEGHGFARPINNMAMFASAEKFLAKYLGGRYQESMTPEVAQRLKEISVDVKTVSLPKKITLTADAKPTSDLQSGTFNYKATIAIGTQTIPLTLKTEIKDAGANWLVTETADTPQGKILDVSTIQKGTLTLLHRSINQGPTVVEIDFKDNKATGTMTVNGTARPVQVDVGGLIVGDGAGAFEVIGRFPLADGYATTLRNFDIQTQKVQMKQLKTVGSESVTVPAGTFDAYKVELVAADNEADKQTVWITKDTHKVVKIVATIPSLGGAILTTELAE